MVDSGFAGAPGGLGTCGQPDGAAGAPTVTGVFEIVDLAQPARHLDLASPVDGGTAVSITVGGQPGDLAYLGVSGGQDVQLLFLLGTFLFVLPEIPTSIVFPLGSIPAGGTLATSLSAPLLAPGVEGVVIYTQGVFIDTSGGVAVGAASATVVLDPSI